MQFHIQHTGTTQALRHLMQLAFLFQHDSSTELYETTPILFNRVTASNTSGQGLNRSVTLTGIHTLVRVRYGSNRSLACCASKPTSGSRPW